MLKVLIFAGFPDCGHVLSDMLCQTWEVQASRTGQKAQDRETFKALWLNSCMYSHNALAFGDGIFGRELAFEEVMSVELPVGFGGLLRRVMQKYVSLSLCAVTKERKAI